MYEQKNELKMTGIVVNIDKTSYERTKYGKKQYVKRYDLTLEIFTKSGKSLNIIVSASNSKAYTSIERGKVSVGDIIDFKAIIWPVIFFRKNGTVGYENNILVQHFDSIKKACYLYNHDL